MRRVLFLALLCTGLFSKAQSFRVVSQTVTTANPDSCSPINVDVATYLGCINFTQGPAIYRLNGSNINIRVNYTSSPICAGAISRPLFQIQMTNIPAGTYTLNTGAFLDGILMNSVSGSLTVTNCTITGLEEFSLETTKVFPNPAKEYLSVQLPLSESESPDYKIFDLSGKAIKQGRFETMTSGQENRISVQDLEAGLYFLELSVQNERKVMKFSVL